MPTRNRGHHVSGPVDLIALIPTLFGFTPTESVVVYTDSGSGFSFRMDLPANPVPDHQVPAYQDALNGLVPAPEQVGTRHATYFLAFAVPDIHAPGVPDRIRATHTGLTHALHDFGSTIAISIVYDGSRYRHLPTTPAALGDSWGPAVTYDISNHPLKATAGTPDVYATRRDELANQLLTETEDDTQEAPTLLARLWQLQSDHIAGAVRLTDNNRIRFLELAQEQLPLGKPLTTDHAALWLHALRDVRVRDAIITAVESCARPAADLLTDLTRRAPVGYRAPVATCAGYAWWQVGRGAYARTLLDHAVADNADLRLAHQMITLIDAGSPPPRLAD